MSSIRCWTVPCFLVVSVLLMATTSLAAEQSRTIKVGAAVSLTWIMRRVNKENYVLPVNLMIW
jgi:ABC-type molybdate transport system substrate-binding protein